MSGTESISRWILWMDVLWAMISRTAGGPSLSQPWKMSSKREFKASIQWRRQNVSQERTCYLHTLCNASTCRSWKSDDSNLIAWFASTTDRTPNPWCLQKHQGHNVMSGGKLKKIKIYILSEVTALLNRRRRLLSKNQDSNYKWRWSFQRPARLCSSCLLGMG